MSTTTEAPAQPERPMIFDAMTAVIKDVAPVGKTNQNTEQRYNFRSIEDVMNAVKAAMTKHGVFFAPTVLQRIPEHRTTRSGSPMNTVHLEMRFDFYATDGSSVSSTVWGEGADLADKATNKAMSAALKYALVQTFCIAAEDIEDSDRSAEEAGRPQTAGAAFQGAIPADQYRAQQANGNPGNGNGRNGHQPQHQQAQPAVAPQTSALATLEDGDDWKARITEVASSDEGNTLHAEIVAMHKAGTIDDDRRRQLEAALREHGTWLLTRHTRPDAEQAADPVASGQEDPWAKPGPDFDPVTGQAPPAGNPGEAEFASRFIVALAECKTTDDFMTLQREIGPALRNDVITPTTSAELMADWRKAKDAAGASA